MHTTPSGHRFSAVDVRRTVRLAVDLLDEFDARHHPPLAARRARVARLVAGIDADRDPLEQVTAVLDAVWAEHLGAHDDLATAGALPARATGSVAALHLGKGGVPKQSVPAIEVDLTGVVGDRQATRKHHGAPFQALCLWSKEVIDGLVADGHPIAPGSAGENITIEGLDWSDVTPGVRLLIGSALCQVSCYAVPCRQNARWFTDRRFDRIHHRHGPVSRLYTTVLDQQNCASDHGVKAHDRSRKREPGRVAVGDDIVLEP